MIVDTHSSFRCVDLDFCFEWREVCPFMFRICASLCRVAECMYLVVGSIVQHRGRLECMSPIVVVMCISVHHGLPFGSSAGLLRSIPLIYITTILDRFAIQALLLSACAFPLGSSRGEHPKPVLPLHVCWCCIEALTSRRCPHKLLGKLHRDLLAIFVTTIRSSLIPRGPSIPLGP